MDKAIGAAKALQSSQDADMMHDAIRGDVLLALTAAHTSNVQQAKEAKSDLLEHGKNFRERMQEVRNAQLTPELQKRVEQVLPLVDGYIRLAEQVVDKAQSDADAAYEGLSAFQQSFSELETQMAQIGEDVSSVWEVQAELADSSLTRTRWLVGLALLMGAVTMVAVALWLARVTQQPMSQAEKLADALADGNLTVQVQPMGNDDTRHLLLAMGRAQSAFHSMVERVKHNADTLATVSSEIAEGNQNLSARTENQASALEETSASLHELASTVRQNADSAQEANTLAQTASQVAQRGGVVVADVVSTMRGINESSSKIGDIIAVIDSIAFQTNILALNAAVEAARAGEQGRGFAVVASEVRALAGRSASAAKEISALITASVQQVERGGKQVEEARATMAEVVQSINQVARIVETISDASSAQSAGVSQVSEAVGQMDQVTQHNAALVEEVAASAASLRAQAQDLVQSVSVFRLSESNHLPAPYTA
ncbi:methyl-accepting chemotaxis protein [Curvibacter sp. CHRR-16]|nr:methyl-accepting chemotaxis protein [Curvibacter sp. CHRR-16]